MTQKEINIIDLREELTLFHEVNEHINFLFEFDLLDDEQYAQLKADNCDKLDKFLKERGVINDDTSAT